MCIFCEIRKAQEIAIMDAAIVRGQYMLEHSDDHDPQVEQIIRNFQDRATSDESMQNLLSRAEFHEAWELCAVIRDVILEKNIKDQGLAVE